MRFQYLLAFASLVILSGCTGGDGQPVNENSNSVRTEMTTTEHDQILTTGGSKFCTITSGGEVWINGGKKGSIEPNGEIWVAGNKEGSLEADGEVWKAGNKVGDITSKLEIWVEGDNVGEIGSNGTVWRNGDSIGTTKGGDPKRAAIVFYFGFFGNH